MEKQRYLADLEKLGKNESTTGSISGYRYAIFRTDFWIPYHSGFGLATYKDVDFVLKEIKKIIDQLEVCDGKK